MLSDENNEGNALHASDRIALERLTTSAPVWHALPRAGEVLSIAPRTVLHCGPPARPKLPLAQPVLNSAAVAAVFEGWAPTLEAGLELVSSGEVNFEPAQDHSVAAPLAAVVSPSMRLIAMCEARDTGSAGYAPINGGGTGAGPGPRYGFCNAQCLERLEFLNGEVAELLDAALAEPIPWMPIIDHALINGDDVHLRHDAAHARLVAIIEKRLGERLRAARGLAFAKESPFFHLNFVMAAVRQCLTRAAGVAGSSLITAFGGNGTDFGLCLSGAPNGRWVTVPATPPQGALRPSFTADDCVGAFGDSAMIEAFGLGALAHRFSSTMQTVHRDYYPSDLLSLPSVILAHTHQHLPRSAARTGLLARRIVAQQATPVVELGVVGKSGEAGGLGVGLYRPPLQLFEASLATLTA